MSLGKRFITDEHVIWLENGKVVRTRNVRTKSREDTWNLEEIVKANRGTQMDLSKGGVWTQGCRKCRAMMEGDHTRANPAHSAECRASVVEFFADDVGFQIKMRTAAERKGGERRPLERASRPSVRALRASGPRRLGPVARIPLSS